ncbi:hypothetical protein PEL8287_00946 [Roseovarius litorisediminis]|uniref:Uncharacterized protein n=1 Tax=Roseovarius litorisediminis TaxID=1312363 RepID=A0A1Y5RNY4_9RHOB|nr:hypothetical protein PEL8287_00946 [Roseovarius litorisediminis]
MTTCFRDAEYSPDGAAPCRNMHRYTGVFWAMCLTGFPPQGRDVPVTVTLTPQNAGELWVRQFGDSTFENL